MCDKWIKLEDVTANMNSESPGHMKAVTMKGNIVVVIFVLWTFGLIFALAYYFIEMRLEVCRFLRCSTKWIIKSVNNLQVVYCIRTAR